MGIIALFLVLVYSLASLVVITGGSLTDAEKTPIIYFLVLFPVLVLAAFTYLVAFRSGTLYPPSEFKNESTYLELHRMQNVAVASLTLAKQTKDFARSVEDEVEIGSVMQSVETALAHLGTTHSKPEVLWVDDNPNNNRYERKAFEAVGISFVLSETTNDALRKLADRSFSAVISDMGRREGPREGYMLLDAMRRRGDDTPLVFYASSNSEEHKQETYRHGGQGCTNDGQELFDTVTRIISSQRGDKLRTSERREGL